MRVRFILGACSGDEDQAAGQLLLRPVADQPERGRRRRGDDALRRVEPAPDHVLLDAERAPAGQHEPPTPGRQRPAHHPRRPRARRRLVPLHRHQRHDRHRAAQHRGPAQHLMYVCVSISIVVVDIVIIIIIVVVVSFCQAGKLRGSSVLVADVTRISLLTCYEEIGRVRRVHKDATRKLLP